MSISMAKEVFLSDITVHQSYLEDALLAVLHTILFVRAPDVVNSKDFVCQSLRPLVFATCGEPQVHKTIDSIVALFKNSLYPYGHYYKGEIVLSFYETKEVKEWVGFVTRYENVCHERWKISFLVINPDLDAGGPDYRLPNYNDTVQLEGSREAAFEQISFNMMKIVETVNTSPDHLPLSAYDYEIHVAERPSSSGQRKSTPQANLQGRASIW